jgi:hypothetical protein
VLGTAANAVGNVVGGAAQAVGSVVQGAGQAVGGLPLRRPMPRRRRGRRGGLDLSGFNPIEAVNNRLLRPAPASRSTRTPRCRPVARDVIFEVARTGELTEDNRRSSWRRSRELDLLGAGEQHRVDQAVEQVTQLRDEAAQRVQQAEEAARDAADRARRAAVLTGFLVAAGFAIALGAAMYGAGLGGRHRDEGRMLHLFRSY